MSCFTICRGSRKLFEPEAASVYRASLNVVFTLVKCQRIGLGISSVTEYGVYTCVMSVVGLGISSVTDYGVYACEVSEGRNWYI